MRPYETYTRKELKSYLSRDDISERTKFRIKAYLDGRTKNATGKNDPYEYSTGKWV